MEFLQSQIFIYVLAGLIIVLISWIITLETRIKKLLRGKSGSSLEGLIMEINKTIGDLEVRNTNTEEYLRNLHNRARKSIQGVHTKRFNPFQGEGQGGNQSFATCFLNGEGNGVIISSLYSRGQMRTFAKPIKEYSSEHELSLEEKEVLEGAKKSNN